MTLDQRGRRGGGLLVAGALLIGAMTVSSVTDRASAHPPHAHGHHDHGPGHDGTDSTKLIEFLEARLERRPNDTITLSKLGATWLDRARASAIHVHYEQAEHAFDRLLALDPERATTHVGLA